MPRRGPTFRDMDSLDRPFRLTPQTGHRLRDVDALAEEHNLRGTHLSHGSMETSLGRAIMFNLHSRVTAALGKADAGLLSLDHPLTAGTALHLPPTTLRVNGDPIRLARQDLPLSGLALGVYAVVWEGYRALVGATTAGRATEPQLYQAVTDAANKPTPTTFHPAGCLDLTGGPSDAPLVTATVQTQKFEQWQYRVRLIADTDLTTYTSDLFPQIPRYPDLPDGELVPAGAYTHLGDGLHRAVLADVPASFARAFDGRLYACKLGLLRVGPAGAEVFSRSVTDPETGWLGAPPAVILPGRLSLARTTEAALSALSARVTALEAAQGSLDFVTNEPFAVGDESAGGSAAARAVPFPAAAGMLAGVRHDPAGSPAEVQATANVRLRVSASLSFAAGGTGLRGVRLLVDGVPSGYASIQGACDLGAQASVNLAAELNVLAGSRLSLEAVQRSGTVLLVSQAILSISRTR